MRAIGCEISDDALEVRFAFGASLAVARISLARDEPFLRADFAVAWRERHAILRCENALRFRAAHARFGSPHGSVERAAAPRTRAERAKYEAPGQRFGRLDRAANAGGLALLALDTYGWSVAASYGGTQLGHSLLRAPAWPDPTADRGEHAFSLAYAPFDTLGMGELETRWERFARAPAVAMFVPDDPRVVVVATKLAADGRGVVVRARECDGAALDVRLACGARAFEVTSIDAHERPVAGAAELRDGAIAAHFTPYEMRSFRVRLR